MKLFKSCLTGSLSKVRQVGRVSMSFLLFCLIFWQFYKEFVISLRKPTSFFPPEDLLSILRFSICRNRSVVRKVGDMLLFLRNYPYDLKLVGEVSSSLRFASDRSSNTGCQGRLNWITGRWIIRLLFPRKV